MWSKFSRNVRIGNAVGYVEIVQRCGNGKLCVTLPWPSLRRLKSPWMVTFVNSPFTITFGLWIVLCSYPIARGEQKLSQFGNLQTIKKICKNIEQKTKLLTTVCITGEKWEAGQVKTTWTPSESFSVLTSIESLITWNQCFIFCILVLSIAKTTISQPGLHQRHQLRLIALFPFITTGFYSLQSWYGFSSCASQSSSTLFRL